MATAGDLTEIGYSNPDVGSGVLYPKADEDATIEYGGFINEDDESMIDGSGERITKKNRRAPMFEATIANDNSIREDYDKVVQLRESNAQTTWTLTHISGEVYEVTGQPVGANEVNLNAGTFTLKVLGNNKMRKV